MKNILITGASSGIGKATVEYLSDLGYAVVMVGRNEEKLKTLCQECENASYYICDLTQLEQIEHIFIWCREKGIKLEGFVHCAGIGGGMPLKASEMEFIIKMMNINCMSFIELAKHFINRKYSSDNASIVVMSSISHLTCYPSTISYSTSKGALDTACKVIAKEVIRRGIRVNTIMPGYVRTPMTAWLDEEDIKKDQPLGFIEAVEIAYLIEFLLSDRSMHITGSSIPVSGGMNF